jgi:Reverse transcriptase (RNA-dependent DNA polymerase)
MLFDFQIATSHNRNSSELVDYGHVYKVWMPETGEIKGSRDVTFWEDDFFGSTGREEKPVPITSKGPAVHVQYGNEEKFQRQIEDRPIWRHDRLLESLEDANLETLFDFTDIEYIQGRIQTLSPEPTYPPIRTENYIADEISNSSGPEDAHESTRESSPNVLQHPRPLIPASETPSETNPSKLRISTRSTKAIPPSRLAEEQAKEMENKIHRRKGTARLTGDSLQGMALPEEPKKYWEVRIPNNFKQAKSSPQWEKWHQACLKKLGKIRNKNAYELVIPPSDDDVKILPGKWVFDLKSDAEGNILEYRARWVVCGNFQEKNKSDRYAPVASDASVKIFLAKVAREDMELRQIDIVSAYLNAALQNRKIFMRQPTGYEEGNKGDAWLLWQALYGLRESACLWYKTFDKKLRDCGFVPLLEGPCVYLRDCLIAATSNDIIEKIVEILHKDLMFIINIYRIFI